MRVRANAHPWAWRQKKQRQKKTAITKKEERRVKRVRVSRGRTRALSLFVAETISSTASAHFIAASSLTVATVTRRVASTSEWKIRVFTDGGEDGWKGGDGTATDSAQQVAPLPPGLFSLPVFLPSFAVPYLRYVSSLSFFHILSRSIALESFQLR